MRAALSARLDALVRPHKDVTDPEDRASARFLATFALLVTPVAMLSLTANAVWLPQYRTTALLIMPLVGLMGLAGMLARTRHHRFGAWLTIALTAWLPITGVVTDPATASHYALFVVAPMLASVLLPPARSSLVSWSQLLLGWALVLIYWEELGNTAALTLLACLALITAVIEGGRRHRLDVEQQRQSEIEARDQRQAALLQAAIGGLALLTDGVVSECGEGFSGLFGYRPDEVLGTHMDDLVVPVDGEQTGPREAFHRDGRIFPVELVAVRYEEVGQRRAVVAVRDLSEHRAIQTRLHQADRMATMGQLAAGVAHEINNPLAWVRGNLELVLETADEEQRVALDRAIEGATRVERIVRDLKIFSRTRPPEAQPVDLEQAVSSAVNMARHQLRGRGLLIEDYSPAPLIDGDETRVGQVCLNLLVNAIEALPEDGEDTNRIEVRLYTDSAGEAVLEVADNGPGIPNDVRHRMFEPFFTTKAQGTGLGLSITRSITASLGGRLVVLSTPGVGTTMRVVLPPGLLRPSQVPRAPTPDPTLAVPAQARVLVIDDEPDLLDLVSAVLSEHDVVTAPSGADALKRCEEWPWDAIVCDLMMPNMTGMELYDQVKSNWPELAERFIFLTGGAYTVEARTFLDGTRAPVVNKPFRLDDPAQRGRRPDRRDPSGPVPDPVNAPGPALRAA